MKKLIALLFSLAFANNSFGMLTSKKNLRSFCTKTSSYDKKNSSDHPLIFKENELNLSTKDNRALLHEIIAQNEQNNNLLKENNDLLRTILKQNYVYSSYKRKFANTKAFQDNLKTWLKYHSSSSIKNQEDLLKNYYTLKKLYAIDVTRELE